MIGKVRSCTIFRVDTSNNGEKQSLAPLYIVWISYPFLWGYQYKILGSIQRKFDTETSLHHAETETGPYPCSFQRSLFVGLNNICFNTDSRIWQKSVSLKVSRRMKRMTRSSNLATRRFSKWFQTKTKNGAFHSSKLKRHLLKNWGQWTGSMLKSIKKSNEEIENGYVTFVVYYPISFPQLIINGIIKLTLYSSKNLQAEK